MSTGSLKDAAGAMEAKGLKPMPPSSSAETWSNASVASVRSFC